MWYLLFILILSALPLIGIFSTYDLPHTHDGLVHLPRMAAYFKALSDGHIPVRWAGDLNYGYGMPLFNFIYQLPYFIASLFLFLGFGLVSAFKLTLVLSYLFSGIFMFAFAKTFFNPSADGDMKALLVSVFYQFAPFRFVELLVRGSFGEVYTYTFLPLVLFALERLFDTPAYKYFFLTVVATAFLILSHNSVSLIFFAVCWGFMLFFSKDNNKFLIGNAALFVGILLSSFYWMPALFEHKYTYGDLFMKHLYLSHLPPFQNVLIPNIFNSKSLQTEGISVQIGLFHVIATLLSLFIFVKVSPLSRFGYRFKQRAWHLIDSSVRRLIIFCLALIIISFFFMLPVSKPLWSGISYLRQFQFPWRFLSVIVFSSSMLSVNFFSFPLLRKKLPYTIFMFLVIVSTIVYWRPSVGYDKINESYYWNFPLNTTYYGETDVIWSAGPAHSYPKSRVEVIGGRAEVYDFYKTTTVHTFTVDASSKAQFVDHTQYYPGWTVYIDDNQIDYEFQDPNHRGEITFFVEKGIHNVVVKFEETKLRLFADILSVVTLGSLIFLFPLRPKFMYARK